jgi:hypothetical protein
MANKNIKKCSTSLTGKEMQIKTILRLHLSPIRMAIIKKTTNKGEEAGTKDSLYTVGGNIN